MTFRDPQEAFADAIKSGRLSADPKAENYAGHYMYMHTETTVRGDLFKHTLTRRYLS